VGLLTHSRTDFAIADFWRFWVVHLWVEDFLELFTTIMVAYIFVLLGVVVVAALSFGVVRNRAAGTGDVALLYWAAASWGFCKACKRDS
jgi:nitric oxide reductase large subunit